VGIEALSRGAARAIFIERARAAVEIIRGNLRSLGLEGRAQVIAAKARTALERATADIVFLDPPYEREDEYEGAMQLLGERPPALAIVQHPVRLALREEYGRLRRVRVYRQGDNALSFFEPRGY